MWRFISVILQDKSIKSALLCEKLSFFL